MHTLSAYLKLKLNACSFVFPVETETAAADPMKHP
jgi:hypothetical protein